MLTGHCSFFRRVHCERTSVISIQSDQARKSHQLVSVAVIKEVKHDMNQWPYRQTGAKGAGGTRYTPQINQLS
jgi:hypothetical protein